MVRSLYSEGRIPFLVSFNTVGARASVTVVAKHEISPLMGIKPQSIIPCTATWNHSESFISIDATCGVGNSRICLLNYKQTVLKRGNLYANAILYKAHLGLEKKGTSF
jgi:hypothetical protein